MPSHYERIKKLLAATPYLVADTVTKEVGLHDNVDGFRRIYENELFPSAAIMELATGLERFANLPVIGKDDREFGIREIAGFAGMNYHLMYHYLDQKVLIPSIRPASGSGRGEGEAKFSWADGFSAGVVGSLRRMGLKLKMLAKVQPLFTEPKKQTAQQVEAVERS
jgi:hypothetical protein